MGMAEGTDAETVNSDSPPHARKGQRFREIAIAAIGIRGQCSLLTMRCYYRVPNMQVVVKGEWHDGPVLPAGVPAIVSAVVQPGGGIKLYVNGAEVMSTTSPAYTAMTPGGWDNGVNQSWGYAHGINIGRNDPDGWTTYNGDLGDVYLYKTAISDGKRTTLESSLATKFGISYSSSDPYVVWLGGFTFAPDADTKPAGDADGDGLSNQQEYAFGLDPTKGSSVNPIKVPFDKSTGTFSFTRGATTGFTYKVWTSTNLLTWNEDTGAVQTPGATVNGVQTVDVTVSPGLLASLKLFVRVTGE